jgi:S-layer homology domain
MRITIELRRPARRSVALVLGSLLLLTPAVVLASHQFPDVPTGHPFHTEIGAIAKAGITAGFPDGGYHPSDPVTRQAMGAFMHRGFGRVGLVAGVPPTTPTVDVQTGGSWSEEIVVRELTITVPGASNPFSPNQLVHLQGHVDFYVEMSTYAGCPCEFRAWIVDVASATSGATRFQTWDDGDVSTVQGHSMDAEALFAAPPGPRTFRLMVRLWARTSTTNAVSFPLSDSSSLSAMTFPFGPTAGNTP